MIRTAAEDSCSPAVRVSGCQSIQSDAMPADTATPADAQSAMVSDGTSVLIRRTDRSRTVTKATEIST